MHELHRWSWKGMATAAGESLETLGPDTSTLAEVEASRFLTFLLPNPQPTSRNPYSSPLRIAILDSPHPIRPSAGTAAMLVPPGRESDWTFSTAEGHLQLLLASSLPLSRLLLVGNNTTTPDYTRKSGDENETEQLRGSLLPFLAALCPRSAFEGGVVPAVPFLRYEDGVSRIVPLEIAVGSVVGEMVVEEVEFDDSEVRRRLRFKKMPNLVQSQIRLSVPTKQADLLVQPYLRPMLAGISVADGHLFRAGKGTTTTPRVVCLGVGGGCLLRCLRSQLGFDVLGVEADDVVLALAKRHFGLLEEGHSSLRLCVADGIKMLMEGFLGEEDRADVLMVDLDSGDAASGLVAPPVDFVTKTVVFGARRALRDKGILVVNVVPLDGSLYSRFLRLLGQAFHDLYQIDVDNADNRVIVATASPLQENRTTSGGSSLMRKLRDLGCQSYMDRLTKITADFYPNQPPSF